MWQSLYRSKRSLSLLLGVSLATGLVPMAFSWSELTGIKAQLEANQTAASDAAQARELVDLVSESQFNLAAAPLDLSTGERQKLYEQTDANLTALSASIGSARGLTGLFLDERAR